MADVDIKAIYATYLNAYESGQDVHRAKRYALETHEVPEKDLVRIASALSGSKKWDKISEIRTTKNPVCASNSRHKKKVPEEFTLPPKDYMAIRLAECEELRREANEDVCPLPD